MSYNDRDISWLSFNERVLQEAADESNPLMERLKFLAIYSSNLEEFYRVRVAHQRNFAFAEFNKPNKFGYRPSEVLKSVYSIVDRQQRRFGKLFYKEILPGLKSKGVHLVQDFSKKKYIDLAMNLYKQVEGSIKVKPITNRKSVFLKNQVNYLMVVTRKRVAYKYYLIELADGEKRFYTVKQGGKYLLFFLDDIIRVGLNYETFKDRFVEAYAVKLSRDAELYLEDEPLSKDLKQKILDSLKKREYGVPTRLLFDELMPYKFLNELMAKTKSDKEALVPGGRYHKFYDFFAFPKLEDASLYFPENKTIRPYELPKGSSVMQSVLKKDLLLAFPYQPYEVILELLEEAANHPQVTTIKITLYRVANQSAVCKLLEQAISNGKKVVVYTELKARFDESSNLYWNKRLRKAGALIYDAVKSLKTHAKLFQIEMEKEGKTTYLAHLGTGNFNEKTAEIYTDFSLLTANTKINTAVNNVFAFLTGQTDQVKTKQLLVAPFNLRSRITELITEEISFKKQGKPAGIILKLNSLEDTDVIDRLYAASAAGVQVDLIIRGICCIQPGVKGLSENIRVHSIVGRYLEHARCYFFRHGGADQLYCSSADFMGRNLDKRVEVGFPMLEKRHKAFMLDFLDLQLRDTANSRHLDAKLKNKRPSSNQQVHIDAQEAITDLIEKHRL
jgi:polyphosphate kinase